MFGHVGLNDQSACDEWSVTLPVHKLSPCTTVPYNNSGQCDKIGADGTTEVRDNLSPGKMLNLWLEKKKKKKHKASYVKCYLTIA